MTPVSDLPSEPLPALPEPASVEPLPEGVGDTWAETLRQFLGRYARRNTRAAYRGALERFARWAVGEGVASPAEIDVRAVQAYALDLVAWQVKPRTYQLHRTALALFLEWLGDLAPPGVLLPSRRQVLQLLPKPNVRGRTIDATPEVHAASMLEVAAARGPRDLLMVQLSLLCGLRTSEVAAVRLGSVEVGVDGAFVWLARHTVGFSAGDVSAGDFSAGDSSAGDVSAGEIPAGEGTAGGEVWALEVHHKGGVRLVPVPAEVRETVLAYLDETGRRGLLGTAEPLLQRKRPGPGSSSDTLDSSTVYRVIAAVAEEAGVPGRVSPQRLRHRCGITFLGHGGGGVSALAQVLGHASLETTSSYVEADRFDEARRALENVVGRLRQVRRSLPERVGPSAGK
ncbi:MAG: tyrosine-type recombinase/integrase [Holophagales bacterium]|nr:tyrosine-type recombinase/integrase [Holophagales bacterium]